MLVAQEALLFTETMISEFGRSSSEMRSMSEWQARYVAILVMLRSIGHIFEKVDCGPPARKQWAKRNWERWKAEEIFSEFIDPARNELIKEFRGGLQLNTQGIGFPALTVDPSMPGGISTQVSMDYDKLRDAHGRRVAPLFENSIDFWRRVLQEAERELGELS